MKYLIIPFILALGILEFVVRAITLLALFIGTLSIVLLIADERGTKVIDFLDVYCFKVVDKILEAS